MNGLPGAAAQYRILFDENYSALLAYATRRVASVEDAKDVVADVLTVAWRRWESVPADPAEQRMWLYGVARRVVSNRHRTHRRSSRLNHRLAGVTDNVDPGPAANDDHSDLATAIDALNALRPDDREILLLSLWEDLTVRQIAVVMALSPANVSVRLHRAKARLRKGFRRQVQDPGSRGHGVNRRAHGDVAPETTA